jgi:hypothetical protein
VRGKWRDRGRRSGQLRQIEEKEECRAVEWRRGKGGEERRRWEGRLDVARGRGVNVLKRGMGIRTTTWRKEEGEKRSKPF